MPSLLAFLVLFQLHLELAAADVDVLLDQADLGGEVVGDDDPLAVHLHALAFDGDGVVAFLADLQALGLADDEGARGILAIDLALELPVLVGLRGLARVVTVELEEEQWRIDLAAGELA